MRQNSNFRACDIDSRKIETREKLFGEPSQTQRLTAFQTHGKVRFCPTGKNFLTSHAVSKALCCLGLPTVLSGAGYESD